MLRYEASVSSVADASCLSMTVYSGLLLKKVFSHQSGLANFGLCKKLKTTPNPSLKIRRGVPFNFITKLVIARYEAILQKKLF
jgi:hypothetical protein